MNRRELITLLAGAAIASPLAARAQQKAMPVVGLLGAGSPAELVPQMAGFRQGLSETGYVEGESVAIEYRWAEGSYDRLPALAADLVHQRVTVIAAISLPAVLAARAATATIPIAFFSSDDPVKSGLVASLNQPGGNATGVSMLAAELTGKRLGLLREMVPNAALIGMLVNPGNPNTRTQLGDFEAASRSIGQQILVLNASTEREIDMAFATLAQRNAGGLVVGADALFNSRRRQLAALAARYAIPAIYEWREFVIVGALMSYGTNLANVYRQVGVYTGRILKGAKPAELPVQRPTRFELVINLKTAQALGLTVPPILLAQADEVIE